MEGEGEDGEGGEWKGKGKIGRRGKGGVRMYGERKDREGGECKGKIGVSEGEEDDYFVSVVQLSYRVSGWQ